RTGQLTSAHVPPAAAGARHPRADHGDARRPGSDLPATIVAVIASRPCRGAEIAREAGLPVEVIPGDIPAARLAALLERWQIGWIGVAVYRRRVTSPTAPRDYTGRVVDIHAALLPRFGGPGMYGDRVHTAVLAAGETESGCTVHLADSGYDEGPII